MSELRQLAKQDVLFAAGETARVYQHTAGLVLLDSSGRSKFDFDLFREHITARISQIPHFHWKLHEVPFGLDLPYWVDDDNFNYNHHIKRIAVPSPGDRVALGELVAHLYSKHLDRSRPLWEIWFIEGLADGKFAVLQKLHHCMMDGQGASKLGEIMCDFEPDAAATEIDRSITSALAGKIPSQWQRSANTAANLAGLPGKVSREIVDFVRPKIWQNLTRQKTPEKNSPVVPPSSLNGDISGDRGFVFGSLSLADIKLVKNHFGVSVNDVVLAVVGSSMRAYLLGHGNLPEESLRTSMAVSLRTQEDDEFSNKVTTASVTLATDLDDPGQRLQAIHGETEQAKKKARGGGKGLVEMMQILPPLLVNVMVRSTPPESAPQMMGANLIVSNVRGSDRPMYIAGARMETMYPMSIITPGIGVNFTCVSYAGKVDFGVTIEPDLVPDSWSIIDGLETALARYLSLAGGKPRGRKKAGARSKAGAGKRAPAKKTSTKKKISPRGKRRIQK